MHVSVCVYVCICVYMCVYVCVCVCMCVFCGLIAWGVDFFVLRPHSLGRRLYPRFVSLTL